MESVQEPLETIDFVKGVRRGVDCGERTFGLLSSYTMKQEIRYEGWVRAGWVEMKRTTFKYEANPLPEVDCAHSPPLNPYSSS